MRISSLEIENFRGFSKLSQISLSNINIFIGPNNSGKSSILLALYLMQKGNQVSINDVRVGERVSKISVGIESASDYDAWQQLRNSTGIVDIILTANRENSTLDTKYYLKIGDSNHSIGAIPSDEPKHFIIPFLSKRKAFSYQENVSQKHISAISDNFTYLAAKLSRVCNRTFPGNEIYAKACEDILGFVVTAIPSANGQKPGKYFDNGESLDIDQLGGGVPHIAGILSEIAFTKGKLILIEEPENDLHPKALRSLLELIREKSIDNQFVVSTHSNIVLKNLGCYPNSRVFKVVQDSHKKIPKSTVQEIAKSSEARMEVLSELGYELNDLELWDGWLILEESSAERIIRDYLIPWFAPKLSRVRTISGGGAPRVEPVFDDFHRLVCFAHLEPQYKKRTWVRVDNDEAGNRLIESLRIKYKDWPEDKFSTFDKRQFEFYYPEKFSDKINLIANLPKSEQRKAKVELLNEVRSWLDNNPEEGKKALSSSAKEVIEMLRTFEREF